MNHIRLLWLIVMAECQPEGQSVCEKLRIVYESICTYVEDDRDIADAHNMSVQNGDATQENCQKVADIIARRTEKKSENIFKKYIELGNNVTEMLEDVENVEKKSQYCPVRYNGKCFWIDVNYDGISCDYAPGICVAQGGKMADIYSRDHYYMLMGYMRTFAGAGGWMHAWLGMTYDRQISRVNAD